MLAIRLPGRRIITYYHYDYYTPATRRYRISKISPADNGRDKARFSASRRRRLVVVVVGIRARPVNADAREIEKKSALGSFLLSSFLSVPYSRVRRDLLDRDTTGHDRSKV